MKKKHVCRATITVRTRVNDGPPSEPMTMTVLDGDTLTIMQPVQVTFAPLRPVAKK